MERIVIVTGDPIADVLERGAVPHRLRNPAHAWGSDGAWLDFYGIVRGAEPDGSPIAEIEYEAHPAMAEHQIHLILDRLETRHPLSALLVVHRIGTVPVGEPSLLVRILSPHRGEALRACTELIDELKRDVPIWKHPR